MKNVNVTNQGNPRFRYIGFVGLNLFAIFTLVVVQNPFGNHNGFLQGNAEAPVYTITMNASDFSYRLSSGISTEAFRYVNITFENTESSSGTDFYLGVYSQTRNGEEDSSEPDYDPCIDDPMSCDIEPDYCEIYPEDESCMYFTAHQTTKSLGRSGPKKAYTYDTSFLKGLIYNTLENPIHQIIQIVVEFWSIDIGSLYLRTGQTLEALDTNPQTQLWSNVSVEFTEDLPNYFSIYTNESLDMIDEASPYPQESISITTISVSYMCV